MNSSRKQKAALFGGDSSVEWGLAGGVLFVGFACLTNESIQLAVLGTLFCVYAGFVLSRLQRDKLTQMRWDNVMTGLPVPFALASEPRKL
jgi:hypothetical protein